MRLVSTAAALALNALLIGCSLNASRDPGFRALDEGEIFTYKAKSANYLDNYELTYVVQARLDRAWECSSEFVRWLGESGRVTSIEAIPSDAPAPSEPGQMVKSRWRIQFRGADTPREFDLLRSDAMKLLKIRLVPADRVPGQLNECTVKMRPFLVGSTLVEAKLQVRSKVLSSFVSIFTSLVGDAADAKVKQFGRRLAEAHRASCVGPDGEEPSGQVHIVSMGVDEPCIQRARGGFNLKRSRFAERDAGRFYNWADSFFSGRDGEREPIRTWLKPPNATAEAFTTQLNTIQSRDGDDTIQEGDIVILFLAGQVESRLNPGRGKRSPHFLAGGADADVLDLTTINCLDILAALRQSPAAACIVFFDGCFVGGSRGFSIDELQPNQGIALDPPPLDKIGGSTALFSAEMLYRDAAESDTYHHGLFTYHLLQKLREASVEGSEIALVELQEYLQSAVARDTNNRQQPYVYIPEALRQCRITPDGRIECSASK